mmetsp:Transcript_31137/g.41554  ORF Transcript_31137/g.41554 Transcript_31137/m.41554 type:complete len:117 (+) Transcript_31137:56-406(+)
MGCSSDSDCCPPGYCALGGQCMYDPDVIQTPLPTLPPVSLPSQTPTVILRPSPLPTQILAIQTPTFKPTSVPTYPRSELKMFYTQNTMTPFEALLKLDDLAFEIQQNPPIYFIVAE